MAQKIIRELTPERKKEFVLFFYDIIDKQNSVHMNSTLKKMFEFYNEIFPHNKKFGIACGPCREQVYYSLADYYKKNK
jgi:hypothetical protein